VKSRFILLLVAGAGICLAMCERTKPQNTTGKKLVWSDDFDYAGMPDSSKWSYDIGGHGWGNNEKQYYTSKELKNAAVENGMLTITATKENFESSSYTSARLVTKNKGDWKYGRIEVKAKLPKGRGLWPAIWMLPTAMEYGGWPKSGEIDIMEHVGYLPDSIFGTVHTGAYNHAIGTQKGSSVFADDVADQFHVYTLDWNEERINIYIDDKLYFTFNNEKKSSQEWPFDKTFYLVLNVAVGGNWGGKEGIDDTVFPQKMQVDYVRVYQ
jgi:beta-glucanase (GH16 family)